MATIINGMKVAPCYIALPDHVDYIFTSSNTFVRILQQTTSVVLSGISGGAGGGCGGVHNSTSTLGKIAPASAGGGGSGYVLTSTFTISNLLSQLGDSSFVSGYEYGFVLVVGAGGAGSNAAKQKGGNGGGTWISFAKRNISTQEIVNKVNIFALDSVGIGSNAAASVVSGNTAINGTAGGNGGYGGRGGRKGYSYNTNGTDASSDGANGASAYSTSTKKYLFNDSSSKIILGKSGACGSGFFEGSLSGYGPSASSGETSYGSGGKGGNYVGLNNENVGNISGGSGQSGVVGIRIFYK